MMSNRTLIARIHDVLTQVRRETMSAKEGSHVLSSVGHALEGVSYDLVKEIDSIVMDLEIAQWYEDEGSDPGLKDILDRAERWLRKIPLDT